MENSITVDIACDILNCIVNSMKPKFISNVACLVAPGQTHGLPVWSICQILARLSGEKQWTEFLQIIFKTHFVLNYNNFISAKRFIPGSDMAPGCYYVGYFKKQYGKYSVTKIDLVNPEKNYKIYCKSVYVDNAYEDDSLVIEVYFKHKVPGVTQELKCSAEYKYLYTISYYKNVDDGDWASSGGILLPNRTQNIFEYVEYEIKQLNPGFDPTPETNQLPLEIMSDHRRPLDIARKKISEFFESEIKNRKIFGKKWVCFMKLRSKCYSDLTSFYLDLYRDDVNWIKYLTEIGILYALPKIDYNENYEEVIENHGNLFIITYLVKDGYYKSRDDAMDDIRNYKIWLKCENLGDIPEIPTIKRASKLLSKKIKKPGTRRARAILRMATKQLA